LHRRLTTLASLAIVESAASATLGEATSTAASAQKHFVGLLLLPDWVEEELNLVNCQLNSYFKMLRFILFGTLYFSYSRRSCCSRWANLLFN
jgi:hypothetical protein